MYSAVFFGWPATTIRPSRVTSTPTCSIDVASTTSTAGASPVDGSVQVALRLARRATASADRPPSAEVSNSGSNRSRAARASRLMSAEEIREVSSARCSMPVRRASRSDMPRRGRVRRSAGRRRRRRRAAHAGQLAGGVEVADQRHVRVGGRRRTGRTGSARRAAGSRRARISADLSRTPVRADAEVPPAGVLPA